MWFQTFRTHSMLCDLALTPKLQHTVNSGIYIYVKNLLDRTVYNLPFTAR